MEWRLAPLSQPLACSLYRIAHRYFRPARAFREAPSANPFPFGPPGDQSRGRCHERTLAIGGAGIGHDSLFGFKEHAILRVKLAECDFAALGIPLPEHFMEIPFHQMTEWVAHDR